MYISNTRWIFLSMTLVMSLPILTTQYDVDDETFDNMENEEEPDIPNVDESESLLSNVVSDVNKTLTNLYNHVTSANVTMNNQTQAANETRKLVKCKEIIYVGTEDVEVEIINGTHLAKLLHVKPEVTSRDVEADCVYNCDTVMFALDW